MLPRLSRNAHLVALSTGLSCIGGCYASAAAASQARDPSIAAAAQPQTCTTSTVDGLAPSWPASQSSGLVRRISQPVPSIQMAAAPPDRVYMRARSFRARHIPTCANVYTLLMPFALDPPIPA